MTHGPQPQAYIWPLLAVSTQHSGACALEAYGAGWYRWRRACAAAISQADGGSYSPGRGMRMTSAQHGRPLKMPCVLHPQ